MLGFVSAVILVSLSAAYSTETKVEDVVFTQNGATVRLNCSGMCSEGQWRGPKENSIDEITAYFHGIKKNPKLNITNLYLDADKASKKYNLIIFNFTYKNLGVYICQCLPNLATDPGFKIHRFRVLYNSSDYATDFPTTISHKKYFYKLGGILGGLCFIFILCPLFCWYKNHQRMQQFELTPTPLPTHVHYDEIGTINNQSFNSEVTTSGATVHDNTENSESSSSSSSVMVGETDGYENPYHGLSRAQIAENVYTNCTTKPPVNVLTGVAYNDDVNQFADTLQETHVQNNSIGTINSDILTRPTDTACAMSESSESSSSSSSIMVGEIDGYENPYQGLSREHIAENAYTSFTPEPQVILLADLAGNENTLQESFDITMRLDILTNETDCSSSESEGILGKVEGYEKSYQPLQTEMKDNHPYDDCKSAQ